MGDEVSLKEFLRLGDRYHRPITRIVKDVIFPEFGVVTQSGFFAQGFKAPVQVIHNSDESLELRVITATSENKRQVDVEDDFTLVRRMTSQMEAVVNIPKGE